MIDKSSIDQAVVRQLATKVANLELQLAYAQATAETLQAKVTELENHDTEDSDFTVQD